MASIFMSMRSLQSTALTLTLTLTLPLILILRHARRRYAYGGGFMLALVFVYLGMTSLGMAVEAMITLLTPRFVPFFLFFMVSRGSALPS